MNRLLTAVSEWIEAKSETHRENVAQRFLNCRCGCGALNDLPDCD